MLLDFEYRPELFPKRFQPIPVDSRYVYRIRFDFGQLLIGDFDSRFDRGPTEALVESYERKYKSLQRKPESFKRRKIKAEPELRQDPGYVPEFVRFPMTARRVRVELSEEESRSLSLLKENGLGKTDEEALRAAFFTWYIQSYRHMPIRGRLR